MTSWRSIVGSALVGAFLLAACGGDGEEAADDSSAASVTEATEATDATEVESTTSSVAASTTEAPEVAAPADTEPPPTDAPEVAEQPVDTDGTCLVGEWVVTEEEMNGFYEGVTATLSAPVTITVEGSAPITLNADRTYSWAPDFTLTVGVAGQVGTGVSGGSITGTWSAVDGTLTTSSDVNALEVQVTVGGLTFDEGDFANGLLNGSPVNGVTYSCDGPTPVLNFLTGDPDVTVPVALTPA